ncbi:hypothetical protein Psi02_70830 [Planotetraspora silvatica]|uniref:Anti-sigma factor antagonist n=1 Tax=Planotetraspora silvatica TaxID=234614 RepID=A0A8J3XRU1_9ACTN|nr:STAS domain-containing protein [Planotetraspora silvatica]GII50659.1 hypothetical protein Psi02_70830 [Planotetraspora silvatica]
MDEADWSEINTFSADTGLHGDVVVVRIAGELDMLSAPSLRSSLAEAVTIKALPRIVVDAADMTFCDSTGLAVLLRARHLALAAGGSLALSGVKGRFARLLAIAGLENRFQVYSSIDEAIDALMR